MATPMTPTQLKAAFGKWGVPFEAHVGWEQHRRDPAHGSWGPVNGLVLHHTGDDAPDTTDFTVLWNGRADLPGPLCTWAMDDNGIAHLISGGRSNHAGGGDPDVLKAVIAENYGDYPPRSNEHQGSSGAVDGNARFYGQETMYSGKQRMTAKAYRSTVLAFAAVCDFHGWSAKSAIGHKEWSDWKPDPGSLDMKEFRSDLAEALRVGPGKWPIAPVVPQVVDPTPVRPPAPIPEEEVILKGPYYFGIGLDGIAAFYGARASAGVVVTSLSDAKDLINAGKRVIVCGGPALSALGAELTSNKSNVLIANGIDADDTMRLATTTE